MARLLTMSILAGVLTCFTAHATAAEGETPNYHDDPTITVLAERLTSADEDARLYWLEQEASALRLRPLVPVLLELLERREDLDQYEMEQICWVLGSTGDPRAADALARVAVESADMSVQRAAAWNLGLLSGESVEDYLISSLAGESEDRVRGAAWALATLCTESALETLKAMMLREDGPPAPEIGFAISRIQGRSSRAFLIEQLSSPNANTRVAATYGLLWRSNYQAIGPLGERLSEDDDDRVRVQAAQSLGAIGRSEAAELLQQALDDASSDVRYAVANALVNIDGRHKDAAALVAALEDEDPSVRGAAATALANTGGAEVTAELVGVLQEDPHTYPRFAAARALGEIGDPTTVQALIKALRDDEQLVRIDAAEALGKLGDAAAVEALVAVLDDLPTHASKALGRIGGTRATDVLIESLKNGNYSAIDALGEIGDPRAIPVLLDHLDVCGAGKAIGKCGDESVLPELFARLQNPSGEELRQATIALGYVGGEEAVRRLAVVSRSSMVTLRKAAIEALGRTREPSALDTVVFALENDPRQIVRLVAAEAVGRIGGERALPILLEKLRDENFCVREGAAWGLGHLGDTAAVEPLIEALADENGLVRIAAAKALGRLGDPSAVEPLENLSLDPHAGPAADEALKQLDQEP